MYFKSDITGQKFLKKKKNKREEEEEKEKRMSNIFENYSEARKKNYSC